MFRADFMLRCSDFLSGLCLLPRVLDDPVRPTPLTQLNSNVPGDIGTSPRSWEEIHDVTSNVLIERMNISRLKFSGLYEMYESLTAIKHQDTI